MRATLLTAMLLDGSSSLPGVSARPATGVDLVEQARAPKYRPVRRYGYRRPCYVPYFFSHPYQYRYWQFYPPICYPL